MHPRQEAILKILIEEYVQTAEPVGSAFLVDRYTLGVSPATVRNDMAALEEAGYVKQPHTSSGRIPTEQAYRYYLSTWMRDVPTAAILSKLRGSLQRAEGTEEAFQEIGERLVQLSGEAVLLAPNVEHVTIVGYTNLFTKPDFQDFEMIRELSGLLDHLSTIVESLYDTVSSEPQVFLGAGSPFGAEVTVIAAKVPRDTEGLVGIIGPLRMNYARNISLVRAAQEALA